MANDAITGLQEYFGALISERRADPGDDLLSALIAEADSGELTEVELVANAWGLYAAGHETTGSAIGNAVLCLIDHPDQLELMLSDRSLAPKAVQEIMRYRACRAPTGSSTTRSRSPARGSRPTRRSSPTSPPPTGTRPRSRIRTASTSAASRRSATSRSRGAAHVRRPASRRGRDGDRNLGALQPTTRPRGRRRHPLERARDPLPGADQNERSLQEAQSREGAMTDLRDAKCFLVGSMSVPTDTVEEAMGLAAEHLGDELSSVPDGEVGLRNYWVAGLGKLTFSRHPDIEEVDGGFSSPLGPMGAHRIKDGTTVVGLEGYLPYADSAISSYEIFRGFKERGELAEDVRFHVAVPTPLAAVAPFFGDTEQWPAAKGAWQRAITGDIRRMVEAIPPTSSRSSGTTAPRSARPSARRAATASSTSSCPGTRRSQPIRPSSSTRRPSTWSRLPREFPTRCASATTSAWERTPGSDRRHGGSRLGGPHRQRSGRQHAAQGGLHASAAIADADRDFFAPLADLEIGDARPFLGIGQRDGAEAIARRGQAAREFLPDFGISHYCGVRAGRLGADQELLSDLRQGAELLAAERAS